MAFDLPADPVVGTIATVAAWGQKVKDSLEYLKTPPDVTEELFLPAYGHTTGALANMAGGMFSYHQLADTLDKFSYFTFKVPSDFVSFTSLKAVWLANALGGNMYWSLNAEYSASGEAKATHTDAPAIGVTANGGVELNNEQEPSNPLTLISLAIGDYVGIRFRRDATNVADTLGVDVYLAGLLFTYIASRGV